MIQEFQVFSMISIFRSRLKTLPDKGNKIQDLYDKVCKELDARNEIDRAAELFSELNIVSIGKKKLNKLEWSGKYNPAQDSEEVYLDSDDEEEVDPLKILARSTKNQEKKLVKVEVDVPLITESDVKEIESFKTDPVKIGSAENELMEPHAVYLCEKSHQSNTNKEKFLPFKTTKSNVHDPEKEKNRKLGKHWENTAATPPLIQHTGIQMLSLQESIEAEKIQREKMKILIEKQAEDRLATKLQRQLDEKSETSRDSHSNLQFSNYRDILEEDLSDKDSDDSGDSGKEELD